MERIFKQQGQGYGTGSLTANVTLDGQVIFDGPVPMIDSPVPGLDLEQPNLGSTCWTWSEHPHWLGQKELTITVSGSGQFQLNSTSALSNVWQPDSWNAIFVEVVEPSSGNTWVFPDYVSLDLNAIANVVIYSDPLSNVTINGVPQSRGGGQDETTLPGQWGWNILPGQTLTATLTVNKPATARN